MIYDYNKEKKILSLDGKGSMIVSKNDPCVYIGKGLCVNDDFKTLFINHYVVPIGNSFKHKIKISVNVLKFIWSK